MEPENQPFNKGNTSSKPSFLGSMINFAGCIYFFCGTLNWKMELMATKNLVLFLRLTLCVSCFCFVFAGKN